VTMAQA